MVIIDVHAYHHDPRLRRLANELMTRAGVEAVSCFEIRMDEEGRVEFHRYFLPVEVVDGVAMTYVTVAP